MGWYGNMKCSECDRPIGERSVGEIREHGDAVYSFVCAACLREEGDAE